MFIPRTGYTECAYLSLRRYAQKRRNYSAQAEQSHISAERSLSALRQKVHISKVKPLTEKKTFLRTTEDGLDQVKDPNVIPYNLRLRKLAKDRNWRAALKCIREIQKQGLRPDEISYATAIDACSKALKSKPAIELFQQMVKDGIRPNVPIYNAVMNACARDHQWKKSLNFLEDMRANGVAPNIVSYNVCLSALEKSKKWNLAYELMKTVRSKGMTLQAITYNTVISACAKSRKMAMCEEVLGLMTEDGFQPDVFTYSALLNGYRKTRNWTALFRLFDEMRAKSVLADAVIYSTVIGAYADAGRKNEAFGLFEEMKARGIKANEIVYSCVLRACTNLEQADAILKEMDVYGVKKNSVVFTSAINVCHKSKANGVDFAVRWFNQMLEQGTNPDWVAYMSLFEVLNNAREFNLLDSYYQQGLRSGVLSHYHKDNKGSDLAIDLHGWSTALARAALRNVMKDYKETYYHSGPIKTLRIMTGKGYSKNQPVLRPAVTKMLTSDFDPPLEFELASNGDILVKPEGIMKHIKNAERKNRDQALELLMNARRFSQEQQVLSREIDTLQRKIDHPGLMRSDSPPVAYINVVDNFDIPFISRERQQSSDFNVRRRKRVFSRRF